LHLLRVLTCSIGEWSSVRSNCSRRIETLVEISLSPNRYSIKKICICFWARIMLARNCSPSRVASTNSRKNAAVRGSIPSPTPSLGNVGSSGASDGRRSFAKERNARSVTTPSGNEEGTAWGSLRGDEVFGRDGSVMRSSSHRGLNVLPPSVPADAQAGGLPWAHA
jgi:hypothetical protein